MSRKVNCRVPERPGWRASIVPIASREFALRCRSAVKLVAHAFETVRSRLSLVCLCGGVLDDADLKLQ